MTSLHENSSLNGANSHGWIGTETVITRLGNFEFKGGYPTEDAAERLADQRAHSRAVEVYLSQMPVVSMYHVWKGAAGAGRGIPNQIVLWETSIDARTVLIGRRPTCDVPLMEESVSTVHTLIFEADGRHYVRDLVISLLMSVVTFYGFYLGLGFEETGKVYEGEVVIRLQL